MKTQTLTRFLVINFWALLIISLVQIVYSPTARAVDCDGVVSSEDCPHMDIASFTGRYRTAIGGDGIYEDNSFGSFSLDVPACSAGPATIVNATLQWAIRDSVQAFWEDGVDISVDAAPATTVTHDRRYKSSVNGTLHYSAYSADITALVLPGTHTYGLTNMDTSGTADAITTQWGYGIHVIYECPEFDLVDVYAKDGLDLHWYNWAASYVLDRSELICQSFTASAVARNVTIDIFLPGAQDATRQADLWYLTAAGSAPAPTAYDLLADVNTPANGGAVLDRLVLTSGDPEWDSYQNTSVVVPAGHEFICIQNDASFDTGEHPDNAGVRAASMFAGGTWFGIPQATTLLSLGNFVWEDTNNNGTVDAGENGICGVEVHLYSDSDSNNMYDSAVEGTTPLQTTTTACGASIGEYQFTSLSPGDYLVVIPDSQFSSGGPLESYVSSTGTNASASGPYEQGPDPDNDVDNDDNSYLQAGDGAVVSAVTLTNGGEPATDGDSDTDTNYSVDFGFFNDAKLGDYVWFDTNNNGLQDSDEAGVPDVTATLYDASTDTSLAVQTTDANGAYYFCYLEPGSYYVVFSNLPDDFSLVATDSGDDGVDSDADQQTARTATYVLGAGDDNSTVDGGIASVSLVETGTNASLNAIAGVLVACGAAAVYRRSNVRLSYRI